MLARVAKYEKNDKHKRSGEKTQMRHDPTAAICPLGKIQIAAELLRNGIEQGWVSEVSGDREAPKHIWSHDDNGDWYEASVTTWEPLVYHGYPVEPVEVPLKVRESR